MSDLRENQVKFRVKGKPGSYTVDFLTWELGNKDLYPQLRLNFGDLKKDDNPFFYIPAYSVVFLDMCVVICDNPVIIEVEGLVVVARSGNWLSVAIHEVNMRAGKRPITRNREVTKSVLSDGTVRYCLQPENLLHRLDGPAIITPDGTQYWYKWGKLHRNGVLPSIEFKNGRNEWWKDGKLHRDGDLPAVADRFREEWWEEGRLHRLNDLPAVIVWEKEKNEQGFRDVVQKEYRIRGDLHRVGAPALEKHGTKFYFQNGKLYREDGPAVEYKDGTVSYYEGGMYLGGNKKGILAKEDWIFSADVGFVGPGGNGGGGPSWGIVTNRKNRS